MEIHRQASAAPSVVTEAQVLHDSSGMAKQAFTAHDTRSVERLDAQIRNGLERAVQTYNGLTAQQRDERLFNTQAFTAADHQAVADVLQLSLALEERERHEQRSAESGRDPIARTLQFDPTQMDRHVGVLLVVIAALTLERQSTGKLQSELGILARQAAVEQGIAIMDAGRAAMFSALGTAVVGAGMSVAGGAVSMKGHIGHHRNLKGNLEPKLKLDSEISALKADLAKRQPVVGAGPATVEVNSPAQAPVLGAAPGEVKPLAPAEVVSAAPSEIVSAAPSEIVSTAASEVSFIDHKNNLHADELAMGETNPRSKTAEAAHFQLRSDLNQGKTNKLLQVGQSVSSVAMIFGQLTGSGLMIGRFAAEQRGIQRDADRGAYKAASDAQAQTANDTASHITKLLEAVANLLRQRSDFINTVASARA